MDNFAAETKELFGADILISLIDLFGDMVLIYRCWLVWGKSYVAIVPPFVTAVAGFGSYLHTIHDVCNIVPHLLTSIVTYNYSMLCGGYATTSNG